jgi:aminoglycoside phosphotransferase (APT) family kinase protein
MPKTKKDPSTRGQFIADVESYCARAEVTPGYVAGQVMHSGGWWDRFITQNLDVASRTIDRFQAWMDANPPKKAGGKK